jgi:hypothetical protein
VKSFSKAWLGGGALAFILTGSMVSAADTLDWRAKQNQVNADIQSWDLYKTLLPKLARQTGWKIHVEEGDEIRVSVKFKNLPQDEALRRLLGKLNYSKRPDQRRLAACRLSHCGQGSDASREGGKERITASPTKTWSSSSAARPIPLMNWPKRWAPKSSGVMIALAFTACNLTMPPAPPPACNR